MKKLLSLLVLTVFAGLLTGGFLVFDRFRQNPEQIVPFPYYFTQEAPAVQLDAPILITGDRMGAYFAKFQAELAATISVDLDKPIKIQSLAKEGHGIHRTLHELKALTQWPQILIFQGGSEEFSENKFDLSEVKKIRTNFARFSDDRIETFLILYPWLSRIVYEPIKRVKLSETPVVSENSEEEYLKRLETELLLYEKHLSQLVNLSRDRNTLLILTTTPINYDVPPKKTCEFTSNTDIDAQILEVEELLKARDIKGAFTKTSRMITQYSGNAKLIYLHGQIAKRLGKIDDATYYIREASAYDCSPWRATELQNSIIRKVAKDNQVLLFDFAKLLENAWTENITFFDETHPQNLYYDKGMHQLGMVIRNILKL